MHGTSLAYKPLPPTCFIAVVLRGAIKQKREFILLQFYCTCADAYNKTSLFYFSFIAVAIN